MKSIKEISEEVAKKLNGCDVYISLNSNAWIYYSSISGYLNDNIDSYYDLYFREKKHGKDIEICRTTENPKALMKIIKQIEPKAKITYTVATTTYKSITV